MTIESPNFIPDIGKDSLYLFLAGSIEMGAAENWQQEVIGILDDFPNVCLLNPRRKDWDSSWEQSITNHPFKEQVEWELDALEKADIILFYFDPNTKSPITLLELGLYADSDKVMVCCPEGYWRKGNVDIICERYKIKTFRNIKEMTDRLNEVKKSFK